MISLSRLAIGQRGRVERIEGSDVLSQRLREMGLIEGDELEVVTFAPLGDPIEIRLRDYRLSLRRSEAERVLVSVT